MKFTKQIKEDVLTHLKAQQSFIYFCRNILGYKKDDSIGFYDLTPTHDRLCLFLQYHKRKNCLILMPRESIKSQIITIGHSLWRLVLNENLRILIYSDSATKAQGFLQSIKFHLEGRAPNSKFAEYYPNWNVVPHTGGKYNESQATISVRTYEQKEPTYDTGGIESSKVGRHYDIIYFDDIVSDLNITTKAQMDKTYDCYRKSLSLLKRGGEIYMTGTRWHYGDAYGRIIAENKDRQDFDEFIVGGLDKDKTGKLLFEDIGLNDEFLEKQKVKQGSYFFSCLYLNSPVSDENSIFKIHNFKYYDQTADFHKDLYITGSCDPAGEGEDFTGIVVCGMDKDKKLYVLDAINKHLRPSQIIHQIIRLNYKWGFDHFAMEENFFGGLLGKDLKLAIQDESENQAFKNFGIRSVRASVKYKTFNRIMALQPYHERGDIYFPGRDFNALPKVFSELAFQMIQFTIDGPKSPHDDLLVALAMQLEIAMPGGEINEEEPEHSSAAWFEREYFSQMEKRNRGIPRRYRRNYEMVFN